MVVAALVGCGTSERSDRLQVRASSPTSHMTPPSSPPSSPPSAPPTQAPKAGVGRSCGPFPPRHSWLQAIGTDGALRWQQPVPVAADAGNETTPTLVTGNLAVLAQDGVLAAFALGDGHPVWRWSGGQSVYGLWSVAGHVVALTDQVGTHARLTALDPATGAVVWRLRIPGHGLLGNQATTGDGGLAWVRADGRLQVVDLSDGRVRWTRTTGRSPTVAAVGGEVLVGIGGTVSAYDARTGDRTWTVRGYPQEPTITSVAGVALVGDSAAGGDEPTALTALDPRTGRVAWRFDVGGMVPTLVGDTGRGLLVATYVPKRRLYLLDTQTGKPRWTVNTAVALDTEPVVGGGGTIDVEGGVAGYPSTRIVDRSLDTGRVRWQVTVPGPLVGRRPLVLTGSVVVAQLPPRHPGRPGAAVGYDPATGHRLWSTPVPTMVQAPATTVGSVVLVHSADPGYACAT